MVPLKRCGISPKYFTFKNYADIWWDQTYTKAVETLDQRKLLGAPLSFKAARCGFDFFTAIARRI